MAESYNLAKFTADVTKIAHPENDAVKIVDAIKPLMAKMEENVVVKYVDPLTYDN